MHPDEDDHGRSLEVKLKDKGAEIEVTLDHEASKLSYHGTSKRVAREQDGEGDEEGEEGSRYVVAVVDRKSGTAEILPTRTGLVARLHHRVKGFVPVQPEDHSGVNRGTYVREFASHREHKRLKEYSEAYIAADSLKVGDEMNAARAAHKAELDSLRREQKAAAPPHDATTGDAALVYSVEGLCEESVRLAVSALMWARFEAALASEEAAAAVAAVASVDPSARGFVEHALGEVHKAESEEDKERAIVAMGYALGVACFLQDEHPKRGERGQRSAVFAAQAAEYGRLRRLLNEAFALRAAAAKRYDLDTGGRIRAVNYAVVAMLLVSPARRVDVAHVCSLFGLVTATAKQHVTAVGCRARAKDAPLQYELVAPLKLPSMAQRMQKQKQKK